MSSPRELKHYTGGTMQPHMHSNTQVNMSMHLAQFHSNFVIIFKESGQLVELRSLDLIICLAFQISYLRSWVHQKQGSLNSLCPTCVDGAQKCCSP